MTSKRIVKSISIQKVTSDSLVALATMGMDELGAIDGVPHVGTVVLVVEGVLSNLVGERDSQDQLGRLAQALRKLKDWARSKEFNRMPVIDLYLADEPDLDICDHCGAEVIDMDDSDQHFKDCERFKED